MQTRFLLYGHVGQALRRNKRLGRQRADMSGAPSPEALWFSCRAMACEPLWSVSPGMGQWQSVGTAGDPDKELC